MTVDISSKIRVIESKLPIRIIRSMESDEAAIWIWGPECRCFAFKILEKTIAELPGDVLIQKISEILKHFYSELVNLNKRSVEG